MKTKFSSFYSLTFKIRQFIFYLIIIFLSVPLTTQAQFNDVFIGNGVDGYIEAPDNNFIDLVNNFTIEAWVNPCSPTGMIVSKQYCSSDYSYYLSLSNGKLLWSWQPQGSTDCSSGNTYSSATNINLNTWTHVVVVHQYAGASNSGITMYINGVQDVGGILSGNVSPVNVTTTNLRISAYQGISGNFGLFLNGAIDELRLWNIVRTPAQIIAARNAPLTGSEAGLVAYYNFDIVGSGAGVNVPNKALVSGPALNGHSIGNPKFASVASLAPPVITGLNPTYCAGDYDIALIGNPAGGNFTIDGIASTVFVPVSIGNHTITYTNSSANGCVKKEDRIVTVNNCCRYKIGNITGICGDVNTKFCVPLTATYTVDRGMIGMDYCLEYDPAVMAPTGAYTLGNLVTHGNNTWASAFLNTTVAGKVRASIFYTSNAPASTTFSGQGEVICIEFKLLAASTVGNYNLSSCELDEAYLLTEKAACWQPGTLTLTYDNKLSGKLIYHGNTNKTLGMGYAVNNPNVAVTNITGSDANCTSVTNPITPDNTGNFNLGLGTFNNFKIVRDIKTLPGNAAYATMKYINGYDTYLMENITTMKTTGTAVVVPDAYMMIAADVNMNDKVRANDITLVQERIVKKITEFPQVWNSAPNAAANSLDWRYIDKKTVDTDPQFKISATYPQSDGLGFYRDNVPNVPFCLPVKQQCLSDNRELYSGILLGDLFDGGPAIAGPTVAYPNAGSDTYIRMSAVDLPPVQFEIDDITELGGNKYRVFVKHRINPKDTLISFDFILDYDETVLSILDLQQTADYTASGASIMWNNFENSEIILTSYALTKFPIEGTLFYIDVYKPTGKPVLADFKNSYTFMNGVEVANATNLRSADATTGTTAETLLESAVSIVPNPSNDVAVITYSLGAFDKEATMEIHNSLGQTIATFTGLASSGSVPFNVSSLAKGVYYCIVTSGNKKIIKKLVVA